MPKRPHIVIFNPDQWRGDSLAHMGHPAAVTPNLDRMAATDGVSFRNAFCQNPVCTPSRCSFMTGWYPHVNGHRTMFHMLHEDEPVLLKTLKDNGYFVWWGGKNDLVPGQGSFEPYCDVHYTPPPRANVPHRPGDPDAWRGEPGGDNYYSFYYGRHETGDDGISHDHDWGMVHGAIDLIKKNQPDDKPLCIYLPLHHPHPAYGIEDPWFSMIDRARVPARYPDPEDAAKPSILEGIRKNQGLQGWTEERWAELRATYLGMCARSDHLFGLLMDALKQAGIYDDTAVFFFSDHGDFTGDYGLVEKTQNTFEDVLTRVPFLIKPPADVPVQPRVSDALVELVDFPATVEALTGIAPEHTHFGRSLLPVLAGQTDEHRDAVFTEGGRMHGELHCMERESRGHNNPKNLYWPRISLQCAEGPEHSKAVMCRTKEFKYVMRAYDPDEFYDLRTDPAEMHNRIADPACVDAIQTMKNRLLKFLFETGEVVPHRTDSR